MSVVCAPAAEGGGGGHTIRWCLAVLHLLRAVGGSICVYYRSLTPWHKTADTARGPMHTPFVVSIGIEDRHAVSKGDLCGVHESDRASSECNAVPKGALPFYAFAH